MIRTGGHETEPKRKEFGLQTNFLHAAGQPYLFPAGAVAAEVDFLAFTRQFKVKS